MPVDGGRTMAVDFPDTVGGPLYVREGSIIPCCEPGEFIGQKPIETISLNIYPADSQTVYTLYEDDGETLAYQKGECALTEVACVREGKKVRLCVGERQGHYDGMPEKRDYIVNLHQARVLGVSLNGRSVPFEVAHDTWCGHSEAGVCRFRMDGAGEAQIEIE